MDSCTGRDRVVNEQAEGFLATTRRLHFDSSIEKREQFFPPVTLDATPIFLCAQAIQFYDIQAHPNATDLHLTLGRCRALPCSVLFKLEKQKIL